MKNRWLLTNKNLSKRFYSNKIPLKENYYIYYSEYFPESNFKRCNNNSFIFYDGYIEFKSGLNFNKYGNSTIERICNLFLSVGVDIPKFIKGNFILIVSLNGLTYIFNDHLGVYKFYYQKTDNNFIVSNSIEDITKNTHTTPYKSNIVSYTLTNHFTAGKTIFENIFYSKPATQLAIGDDIAVTNYWDYRKLISNVKQNVTIDDIGNRYKELINNVLNETKNVPLLSLTGGMDSRTLLAANLNLGLKPNLFTYGQPEASDVKIAEQIAQDFSLNHYKPYLPLPTKEWFKQISDEIISTGNSLLSPLRAYRYSSIKDLYNNFGGNNIILTGYLGGETIRGMHIDGNIISKFLWQILNEKEDKLNLVKKYFDYNFIDTEILAPKDFLEEFLETDLAKINDRKLRELALVFDINSETHLTLDIDIYNNFFDRHYSIYMDIDFLELLFKSKYSMMYKDNSSSNPFNRINNPLFHSKLIEMFEHGLLDYYLTNGYKPAEYLKSKYWYLLLMMIRKKNKNRKQTNFSYSNWFYEYLKLELKDVNWEYFDGLFNKNKLLASFSKSDPAIGNENYWRRYYNIIMFNNILKHYLQ